MIFFFFFFLSEKIENYIKMKELKYTKGSGQSDKDKAETPEIAKQQNKAAKFLLRFLLSSNEMLVFR